MGKRALIAATMAAVGAALLPASASACSCIGYSGVDDARQGLKRSDGAIIGRVTRIRRIPDKAEDGVIGPGRAVFVYRIRRSFKRIARLPPGKRIRVHTSGGGGTCGLEHRRGKRGALFLDRRQGRWHSSLCQQISGELLRRAASSRGAGSSSRSAEPGCDG